MLQNAYQALFSASLFVLAALCLLGLFRAIRGPRIADRIIAINMISTLVIAIICVLAVMKNEGYLVDVALIYSLLGFLAVVVLCKVYLGIAIRKKEEASREPPADTAAIADAIQQETASKPTRMQNVNLDITNALNELTAISAPLPETAEENAARQTNPEPAAVSEIYAVPESASSQEKSPEKASLDSLLSEISSSNEPFNEQAEPQAFSMPGLSAPIPPIEAGNTEEASLDSLLKEISSSDEPEKETFTPLELPPVSVVDNSSRMTNASLEIGVAMEAFNSIEPAKTDSSSEKPRRAVVPIYLKKASMPSVNYSRISEWEKSTQKLDDLLSELEQQNGKDE